MKKKAIYLLTCLIFIVSLVSCNEEEKVTPLAVAIKGAQVKEMVLGDTLNLSVEVSEGLKYNWAVDGKVVSTSSNYKFTSTEIGKHVIRLTVSNEQLSEASTEISINVYGKYKNGIFVLNEGAVWGGDKCGYLIFISPQGEVVKTAFQTENNGAMLGSCPQDLFIANNKMYIVSQNGGNEGGFLTVLNAETLKMEAAYEAQLKGKVDWPTHVAVLSDNDIYLRDNTGISVFHPSNGEITFIQGTESARKNTMAVVQGKVFASQGKKLLVIEKGKDNVSATVEFDGVISGVIKSSDNNVWVSVASGKIAKVNAKDYSIIKVNDLSSNVDAKKALTASVAATPGITAKGDTLYMSALNTKIFRHIFSKDETKLMVDAKNLVENANIVYNTTAVDPVTGGVYLNTIKGFGPGVNTNQISVFDFSGTEPKLKAAYNDYTKFPAGIFFTHNFK